MAEPFALASRARGALVLALIGVAVAAVFNSIAIVRHQATLDHVSRYNLTWLLSQAAHELLRLQEAIGASALPGSVVDADDVALRVEIFQNRLALLQKGEAAEFISTRPEFRETISALADSLKMVDSLAAKLPDPKVSRELRDELEPLVPKMLQLAAAANQRGGENVANDQRVLSVQHWSLAGLLFFAGFVILILLYRQQKIASKLRSEMEHLNSLFQSSGAYFMMLDRDERVIMANRAWRELMGSDHVMGETYSIADKGGLDATTIAEWRSARGAEALKPAEYESLVVDSEGRNRIIKNTATPIQDREGHLQYIVLIGVDDTERRQAEIRLFDASRLANLGEMASGVAHEINQPLAVIRMAADSLEEELDSEAARADPAGLFDFIKQKLQRISQQTERASGIIRELRTVARKPSDELVSFSLSDAARISVDLLGEQLRASRVELTLDLPHGAGPLVVGQMSRLQQVVINLVLNARDAIIETARADVVGPIGRIVVRVLDDQEKRTAMIVVEDDGSGIPETALPRLFEPFFTTKATGKGTGLGLSISYNIVRQMNGRLSAANRPEGGARFSIVLPEATRLVSQKTAA